MTVNNQHFRNQKNLVFVVVWVQSQVYLFFNCPLWVITENLEKTSPEMSEETTVNNPASIEARFPLSLPELSLDVCVVLTAVSSTKINL